MNVERVSVATAVAWTQGGQAWTNRPILNVPYRPVSLSLDKGGGHARVDNVLDRVDKHRPDGTKRCPDQGI